VVHKQTSVLVRSLMLTCW